MAEHILRFRSVATHELRSEESIVKREGDDDLARHFLGAADRPEPYRSYYIAYTRLEPVFQREQVHPQLLVETPRGRGLLWRVWPAEMGVVLLKHAQGSATELTIEEKVTTLRGEEASRVRYVLDQIVLNPPKFG